MYTPITVIDSYLFPHEYKIADLPLLIDQVIEQREEAKCQELSQP